MSAENRMARIVLIGCGGTIASLADDPLDTINYPNVGRKIGVAELLSRIPDARSVADISPVDFCALSSPAVGFSMWLELRRRVLDEIARGAQGIVITHGTGSLEETAFFLSLTLDADVPVVLTGAQRPLSAVGSDAPMNLVAAIRVAAAREARGHGVLVVMNDEIHAARDVVKTSTYSLQAFQSPSLGPIGHVYSDGIIFERAAIGLGYGFRFGEYLSGAQPRVDIVYSHTDADGELVRAAVAAGAKGIVSAGFAPGIPTPTELKALQEARVSDVLIVQASRAGSGRVALRTGGFIAAETFNPQKARLLLMLCLMARFEFSATDICFRSFREVSRRSLQ